MRLLFFISLFTLALQAHTILVINSNSDVKKYNEAVEEFGKNFNHPFKTLDISNKSSNEIKKLFMMSTPIPFMLSVLKPISMQMNISLKKISILVLSLIGKDCH